jgi:peptidoglycan/xylan/chitin deacetylase (PgdA/CDA1 family)
VTALAGRRPTGYVAPWWEFSTVTNELLLERGIKYDHSLMHHDHQPYYVRVGDKWTKIDYSKQPVDWMVPLERGRETELIEIPASWYLDDLPPMLFIKKSPNSRASSTHATSKRCGATSSTGCTANTITRCSRSRFIRTYPADRMC